MPVLQQGSVDEDTDVNDKNSNSSNALLLLMCWHNSCKAIHRDSTGKKQW